MRNTRERFRGHGNVASICLVGGLVLALGGAIHMFFFFRRVRLDELITVRQMVMELVIPHMVCLLGIALVTASFISFTRTKIIRMRQGHQPID